MTNDVVARYLPENKRRATLSSTDGAIGTTPAESLRLMKEMSGRDCGTEYDCLEADGSGFYIFDTAKIGKPVVHGHWALWRLRG
jgi:hypothetical protein